MTFRTKTTFIDSVLDEKESKALFEYLQSNIQWEEGIRSKKGFTRLAKSLIPEDYPEITDVILRVLSRFGSGQYALLGIYLNLYSNGDMWLPNHSHPGTQQLIISLGASRTLTVAKKEYLMTNGSGLLFGSAIHGIKKEPHIREARISIAVFLKRLET